MKEDNAAMAQAMTHLVSNQLSLLGRRYVELAFLTLDCTADEGVELNRAELLRVMDVMKNLIAVYVPKKEEPKPVDILMVPMPTTVQ